MADTSRMLYQRLDSTIQENRVTIAFIFPMIGAITLLASAEGWLPSWIAFNAVLILIGTLVMRSPLLVGVWPLLTRRAGVLVLFLIVYTYLIELVGVTTGIPYGAFSYLIDLGPMFIGIPVGLPLFFIPLVINAYLLAVLIAPRLSQRWSIRIPFAIALVVAIDLVLDPAAVALGFWAFDGGGIYYDVPITNYLGWVFSGTIAVIAIDHMVDVDKLRVRADNCVYILDDLMSFILLWGVINLYYVHLIPVLITGGLLIGLLSTGRYDQLVDPNRLADASYRSMFDSKSRGK